VLFRSIVDQDIESAPFSGHRFKGLPNTGPSRDIQMETYALGAGIQQFIPYLLGLVSTRPECDRNPGSLSSETQRY